MSTSTRDAASDQLQLLLLMAADYWNGDRTNANAIYTLASSLAPVGDPVFDPVNVDVPFAQQVGAGIGSSVTCTMGNWNGQPSSYSYQWVRDSSDNVGTNSATYPVAGNDIGHTMACTVTASNALGSTAAPASNSVTVV